MNLVVKFLFIIFFIFLNSCSKEENKISIIKEDDIQMQMIEAYKEGIKALKESDVLYASKKFN